MLSWSGHEQDVEVDLSSMEVGLPHAAQLRAFAAAATSPAPGADELAAARAALLAAVGEAATVDAAAVVANFEMMTRLADCTGAVLDNPMSIEAGRITGADGFASRH